SRESLRKVEQHLQLHPDDVRAIYLGAGALHGLGEFERAVAWADRALAMEPEEPAVLYNVACTYAVLGEVDKAIDCLDKAFQQGFGHLEWVANDPDLARLRDHPRYKRLMWELEAGRHAAAG